MKITADVNMQLSLIAQFIRPELKGQVRQIAGRSDIRSIADLKGNADFIELIRLSRPNKNGQYPPLPPKYR